jgi:hypothetical protein
MCIALFLFLSPLNTGRFLAGRTSESVGEPTRLEVVPTTGVFSFPPPVCSITLPISLLRRRGIKWTAELGFARGEVICGRIATHVVSRESAWSAWLFWDVTVIVTEIAG